MRRAADSGSMVCLVTSRGVPGRKCKKRLTFLAAIANFPMSNIFDTEIFAMASLSYREKTLYATLVIELAVFLPYFFLHGQNSVGKVAGMIAAIIVLQIVAQAIIAALTRNRLTDERDRLIELRGYRVGYFTFASLMALGLAALWFHTSVLRNMNVEHHNMGLHFLSVFFCMLIIADIARTVAQLIAYRRSL